MKSYLWGRRDGAYRMPRSVAEEAERRLGSLPGVGRGQAAYRLLMRLMRCHLADKVIGRSFAIERDALATKLAVKPGMIRGAIKSLLDHGFLIRITVGTPKRKPHSPKYEPVLYRLAPLVVKPVQAILAARKLAASRRASSSSNQNLRIQPKAVYSGEPVRTPRGTHIFPPPRVVKSVAISDPKLEAALARIGKCLTPKAEGAATS